MAAPPSDPRKWRKPQIVKWLTAQQIEDPFITSNELRTLLDARLGRVLADSTFYGYYSESNVEAAKAWRNAETGLAERTLSQWETLTRALQRALAATGNPAFASQLRLLIRDRAIITGAFDEDQAVDELLAAGREWRETLLEGELRCVTCDGKLGAHEDHPTTPNP